MIAAVLMVLASIALTFYFSSPLLRMAGFDQQEGYRNVTFTDAVLSCQHEAEKTFGRKLSGLALDDHSSRRDDKRNRFLIFFHAGLSQKDDVPAGFYIQCEVHADNGRIAVFEGLETKTSPVEAIEKNDGGMFGWPR